MAAPRPAIASALALLLVTLGAAHVGGAPAAEAQKKRNRPPPNIVVVMSDDQTLESLRVMPKVDRLLADQGVSFTNSFASNPVCCPSRATFLTGQYAHNHGVLRNTTPFGGFGELDGEETLPVWLQRAGYFTAHVGKYLNGYGFGSGPLVIPRGWSEWHGSVDPSTYSMYGYTLNEEGTLVTYGDHEVEDPATYQTDVYAAKAADLIARRAPKRKPLFLSVAPLAPHVEVDPEQEDEPPPGPNNPRSAPRHAGAFEGEPQPRTEAFNEADVSDKPAEIRALAPLTAGETAALTLRYRDRLASLVALDELVETIVGALGSSRELRRTLVVFTSDNGYLLGEHRVRARKQYPYEESIRVPLILRGPGLPSDARRRQPVLNADLAPTILHYAEAEAGLPGDGRSLHRLIDERRLEPGRGVLIENWCQVNEPCFDPRTPRYVAVRTARYLYAEYSSGERELYDLEHDPLELESRHADPAYADERAALGRLLDRLRDCARRACRARPKLELRLDYRPGEVDGRRCALSAVEAKVRGADRGEALESDFRLRGKPAGGDVRPPLRARFGLGELDDDRRSEVEAAVTVLDGRVRSLAAKAPRRC